MYRNALAATLVLIVVVVGFVWQSSSRKDRVEANAFEAVAACPTIDPATPVLPVDAIATPLSSGILSILDPCRLTMSRWIIGPGGSIAADDYPPAEIYVESGVVTVTLNEGIAWVWPMHDENSAFPVQVVSGATPEPIELVAGDSVFIQDSTYGINVSAEAKEETVLTVSSVRLRRGPCPPRCWEWP
jgi:hypothetical protein